MGDLRYLRRSEVESVAFGLRDNISADCDGHRRQFYTTEKYKDGTMRAFINGLWQGVPPTHFVELGDQLVEFTGAPDAGDEVWLIYQRQ